jgi:hypothetical protein
MLHIMLDYVGYASNKPYWRRCNAWTSVLGVRIISHYVGCASNKPCWMRSMNAHPLANGTCWMRLQQALLDAHPTGSISHRSHYA